MPSSLCRLSLLAVKKVCHKELQSTDCQVVGTAQTDSSAPFAVKQKIIAEIVQGTPRENGNLPLFSAYHIPLKLLTAREEWIRIFGE
jgi:hypothetical protein